MTARERELRGHIDFLREMYGSLAELDGSPIPTADKRLVLEHRIDLLNALAALERALLSAFDQRKTVM